MPFNYNNLNLCIARVVSLTDNLDNNKEEEVGYKLEDSAATKPGSPDRYRPLIVSAMLEEQSYDTQVLTAANDGIRFSGNLSQIVSWLREQIAQDKQLIADGYTIPLGYDAYSAYRELLLKLRIDPDEATGPIMSIIVA